jgi:hypothetical protein
LYFSLPLTLVDVNETVGATIIAVPLGQKWYTLLEQKLREGMNFIE